jgi:pyridoxal biosynthesis lyase PdxS
VELDLYHLYSTKFSLARQCGQTSLPELTTRLTEEAADIRTTTQQMKAVRRFRCSIKTLDIDCRTSGSWWNSSAMTMTSANARMTVVAAIVPTSSGPLQHCLAQTETCDIASHQQQLTAAVTVCAGLHTMRRPD